MLAVVVASPHPRYQVKEDQLGQGAFRRTSADINLGGGGGESVSEVLKSTRKVEIDELVHISFVR